MDIDDLPLHDSEVNEGHLDPEIGCSSIDVVTDQLAASGPGGLAAAAAIHSTAHWYNEDHSYVGDFEPGTSREFLVGDLNQNSRDCSMETPSKLLCHQMSRSPIHFTKSFCDVDKPADTDPPATNGFITNPVARNRLNSRLLRKIRLLITHMASKCGQQASLVLLNPGFKGSEAKRNFRVFGSEPLCQSIRSRKFEIMRDFMDALNEQAEMLAQKKSKQSLFEPHEWRENVKDESLDMGFSSVTEVSGDQNKTSSETIGSYFSTENQMHAFNQSQMKHPTLPPLQVDSIPTPLKLMTASQLRIFIPFMLKSALNRGKPGWGNEMWCPAWWPTDIIPWENVRTDSRLPEQKKAMSYKEALREVVRSCYRYHSQEHLLDTLTTAHSHTQSATPPLLSTAHQTTSKTLADNKIQMGPPNTTKNVKVYPKSFRVKLVNWNSNNSDPLTQTSRVMLHSSGPINEHEQSQNSIMTEQSTDSTGKPILMKSDSNPDSLYLLTKGATQILLTPASTNPVADSPYSNLPPVGELNDQCVDPTQFLQSENSSPQNCGMDVPYCKSSSKLAEPCSNVGHVRYSISLASGSGDSMSSPVMYPASITIPTVSTDSSQNGPEIPASSASCVSIKHLLYLQDASSTANIISIKADSQSRGSDEMNNSPRIRLVYDPSSNSFVPRDSLSIDHSSILLNNPPSS